MTSHLHNQTKNRVCSRVPRAPFNTDSLILISRCLATCSHSKMHHSGRLLLFVMVLPPSPGIFKKINRSPFSAQNIHIAEANHKNTDKPKPTAVAAHMTGAPKKCVKRHTEQHPPRLPAPTKIGQVLQAKQKQQATCETAECPMCRKTFGDRSLRVLH